MNSFDNGNPKKSRITSIDILNSHDISLLLTASGTNFTFNIVGLGGHLSFLIFES